MASNIEWARIGSEVDSREHCSSEVLLTVDEEREAGVPATKSSQLHTVPHVGLQWRLGSAEHLWACERQL